MGEMSQDSVRNLVLCLDGTRNEPETGTTNVSRIFDVAVKNHRQLVFYHPGVGVMGARGAVTSLGQKATRVAGLIGGFGVKDNLEEAYRFLVHNYRSGDRIFVFGFSRGAYTAQALTGMLRTVGLLRSGAENLIPYAVKLYATSNTRRATTEQTNRYFRRRERFARQFGNPAFPEAFDSSRHQVHFLGVWDTVKSVGWLNWKAQIEQVRWPFTAKIVNVDAARQALAIDERRHAYKEYRFDGKTVKDSGGRYEEMWFAGAHSDIGGTFDDDHDLSDIAFAWMVEEAAQAGLRVDPQKYRRLLKVRYGAKLPVDRATGKIHTNSAGWWFLGGWHRRHVQPGDQIHPSVFDRIHATAGTACPYRLP
ncbi:DUF2235 domain-containing protein [Streptomyces panaciradicis]|uniref:DUF2235 domain-containing protein n=1 Tax=Streptomyces panaciradicis TaxID=1470261 RepID=UPI00201D2465|nr:DUF2235 domain-containing protein [Streptomyces panaciradicis]MCL6667524.1 DUF2235 domain-containing protein [Streptomyces panaciradicis]